MDVRGVDKIFKFVCDCCGKEAQKPLSEYNRNKKLGRKNFCSRSCAKGNVQFISLPINLMKSTKSDIEVKQFLKQISSYTSHFCEDETISSPKEVLGAQAGN